MAEPTQAGAERPKSDQSIAANTVEENPKNVDLPEQKLENTAPEAKPAPTATIGEAMPVAKKPGLGAQFGGWIKANLPFFFAMAK
jgi:hypothetical protein